MPENNTSDQGDVPPKKILVSSFREEIMRLFRRTFLFTSFLILDGCETADIKKILEEEKPFMMIADKGYSPFSDKESVKPLREISPSTAFVMISDAETVHFGLPFGGFDGNILTSDTKLPKDFRIELQLCSDPVCVAPLTHFFSQLLGAYTNEEERASIRLGLMEILLNAIEHGNLEIDFATKTAALEDNCLKDLIEQRKMDPRFLDRCVTIEMRMEKFGCRFVITDEGDGFEWHNWIDETGRVKVLASHGRGILMSRFYFDDIAYNPKGNRVTLFKMFQSIPDGNDESSCNG